MRRSRCMSRARSAVRSGPAGVRRVGLPDVGHGLRVAQDVDLLLHLREVVRAEDDGCAPTGIAACPELRIRRSGRRAKDFDVTRWPGRPGQPPVASEQGRLQRLGERYVGRVVDREVVAQLPAAGEQWPMRCSKEG